MVLRLGFWWWIRGEVCFDFCCQWTQRVRTNLAKVCWVLLQEKLNAFDYEHTIYKAGIIFGPGVGRDLVDFSRKTQVSSNSLTSVRKSDVSWMFKMSPWEQESSLLSSQILPNVFFHLLFKVWFCWSQSHPRDALPLFQILGIYLTNGLFQFRCGYMFRVYS